MNSELYAIVALAARYLFCAMMVLIVLRAWRITVVDNRRAKILRAWTSETGCIGEFLINPGKGKGRARVSIPREGVLGSGGNADVRIKHADLNKQHAYIEQREGGLLLRPLRGANVEFHDGAAGEQLLLRDGDVLSIGRLKLMLILFDAAGQPVTRESSDEWVAPMPGAPSRPGESAAHDADSFDEFFEEEELWPEKANGGGNSKKR